MNKYLHKHNQWFSYEYNMFMIQIHKHRSWLIRVTLKQNAAEEVGVCIDIFTMIFVIMKLHFDL